MPCSIAIPTTFVRPIAQYPMTLTYENYGNFFRSDERRTLGLGLHKALEQILQTYGVWFFFLWVFCVLDHQPFDIGFRIIIEWVMNLIKIKVFSDIQGTNARAGQPFRSLFITNTIHSNAPSSSRCNHGHFAKWWHKLMLVWLVRCSYDRN